MKYLTDGTASNDQLYINAVIGKYQIGSNKKKKNVRKGNLVMKKLQKDKYQHINL